ncbi:PIG-L deacetylase family protein [Alteriqipengyuania sp.]|uniref:PIG-L deacetylase family protein n=2 Tax=Alteriqipengyuania sp. TaxID=2800692 RepID=UPI003516CDF4
MRMRLAVMMALWAMAMIPTGANAHLDAASVMLAGSAEATDQQSSPVLVILAHPDDELPMAPALAALVRTGADVRLLYTTRGDAGPGVSDYAPGEALAAARSAEATCAASALGLPAPRMLDFPDGGHGDEARGTPDGNGLAAALSREIQGIRPGTIITWGPDGGYGHVDHRMVHAFTTQLVQAMPAAERPQLLYFGIRADRVAPVAELERWAKTDPELLSVRIEYEDADLAAANAATQCHVTQFDAATRAALAPVFHQAIWQGTVDFRPAFAMQATAP